MFKLVFLTKTASIAFLLVKFNQIQTAGFEAWYVFFPTGHEARTVKERLLEVLI